MKWLENIACRFLIWRFKVGYGADCETSDLDDFEDEHMGTHNGMTRKDTVLSSGRCASCRAEEAVHFLRNHIEL